MAWLKIYDREHRRWPRHQKVRLSQEQARLILKAMSLHFNVPTVELDFSYRRGGGKYFIPRDEGEPGRIRLSCVVFTVGYLCHEFAHHLNYFRNNVRGHTGTFWGELEQVYDFIEHFAADLGARIIKG